MAKVRNSYLDFFKGIACFGVVFFHVKWPHYYPDGIVQAVFRFAIPLFFMISGYFCVFADEDEIRQRMTPKIRHIFVITVVGCLYYFVFQIMIALMGNSHGSMQDLVERFKMMFNPKTFFEWLILNQDPFINIMWFTSALLYCYLLMWMVAKWNLYKIAYLLIPVFVAIHLCMGNVAYLFGVDVNLVLYRNFLLFGFPFFMLGVLLQKKQKLLKSILDISKCYYFIAGGMLLSIIEWFIFSRQELFVGSIITVVGIFVLTFHKPQCRENAFLTRMGRKYSLFIYITHASVSIVMDRFVGEPLSGNTVAFIIYRYLKVFVVLGLCLAGAIIFTGIMEKIKRRGTR